MQEHQGRTKHVFVNWHGFATRQCTEAGTWVHSSVVRAADCRSADPWFKSGCALMHAHLEPTASPSTCTHIVLTHPVPPVCGMRSHTSPPACMPARSTFSPDNAPADCPRLDYAVASRAASHVGLCKQIRFVCLFFYNVCTSACICSVASIAQW